MNARMMEDAQALMADAESVRQELIAMCNTGLPLDQAAYDAKHNDYGQRFIAASAAVAEATYAPEDE